MTQLIKSKLDKIAKYAKNNSDWIRKLIVFGDVLVDNNEDDIIELAVDFNDDFDIDECFDNLITIIDNISEGMFELLIINGDNLTSNALKEIEEGVVIYEASKKII